MPHKEKTTNIYLFLLLPFGIAGVLWALTNLPYEEAGAGLFILAFVTVFFSSYLRIQLPRTKIHFTVSDALVLLSMLLYGGAVAILLTVLECTFSAWNLRRQGLGMKWKTAAINVLIATISISSTFLVIVAVFGPPVAVVTNSDYVSLVWLLGAAALSQFLVTTIFVSAFMALRTETTLLKVWNDYCLNALVMFVSASIMAGIGAKALSQINVLLFAAACVVFGLVYFTYRRYVDDIKATSVKAEEAERMRAEQAESHVSELEHYIGELEKSGEALRESRERFRHAAFHDDLTDLANRNKIVELLQPYITNAAGSSGDKFALLFLDLNRFKAVNDSLGHSVGDLLLLEAARRLCEIIGDRGVVARLGGDEFVILLTVDAGKSQAIEFAEKINKAISAPYDLNGRLIFSSGSLGMVIGGAYRTPNEILRDADIAMYHAKETNQGYVIFDRTMHARAVTMLELETDLRVAIERDEFELFYQPLVEISDVSLMGFEALVRWNHPRRGMVSPGEFIPLAESTGLIIPMTKSLLQRACEQAAEWIRGGADPSLVVSVNVAAGHLQKGDLVDDLQRILKETKLSPQNLKLEITESGVMDNAESAIEALGRIKALGVKVSIDDFGTGYSSLSYLHKFPIHTLKIDRSFVKSMADSSGNGEIVKTIISLADSLGLSVIAEGIESIEQFQRLRALGCDYGQGYLFSRPVPASEARRLLENPLVWRQLAELEPDPFVIGHPVVLEQTRAY